EVMLASLDPAQRSVSTIDIVAPRPLARPLALASTTIALDPDSNPFTGPDSPFEKPAMPLPAAFPRAKPLAMIVATRGKLSSDEQTALGAISAIAPVPRPRELMTPRETDVVIAYAPEIDPDAQRALDILIQRETAASAVPSPDAPAEVETTPIRTASLGGTNGLNAMTNIFDMTWTAVTAAGGRSAIANTLVSASLDPDPLVGLKPRNFDLVAPELDHVNE